MAAIRYLLLVLATLCGLWSGLPSRAGASPPAGKPGITPERRVQLRARASLARACIATHQSLVRAKLALPLPPSEVLPDAVAASKTYGSSWTCRDSTRMLGRFLALQGENLALDSSGPNTFRWGKEGWVSYHYYGVDDPRRPTLLVDPTAASNYGRDARPGGLLPQWFGTLPRSRSS